MSGLTATADKGSMQQLESKAHPRLHGSERNTGLDRNLGLAQATPIGKFNGLTLNGREDVEGSSDLDGIEAAGDLGPDVALDELAWGG